MAEQHDTPLKRPRGRPRVDPTAREVLPVDGTKLNGTGRKVLSLYLRGFRQKEIAKMLGFCEPHVSRICRERRFIEALDASLGEVDQEILRLKPDAYRAMVNGLRSQDEATGLRASEIFFKLTGQGGYGAGDGDRGKVSAEDIAQALLAAGGGKVTIDVQPAGAQSEEAPAVLLEPSPVPSEKPIH